MIDEFQVFISYARPDQQVAVEVYEALLASGFSPWLDERKIKGGQNWEFEIQRALEKSTIVIILWSQHSKDRRGYVQKEIKLALDKLQEKLVDDIFIVPVLLDQTLEIPEQLQNIHCLNYNEPDFLKRMDEAITHQIERLGGERKRVQEDKDLHWSSTVLREEWDGLPGYAVELQLIEFKSDRYPNAVQIGQFLRGEMLSSLFGARLAKLNQYSDSHNFAEDKWARTNTIDAHCGDPIICNKVVTLKYLFNWYGAGAAHPTHGFITYAFVLDPLTRINSLASIFKDSEIAFSFLQTFVRQELVKSLTRDADMEDKSEFSKMYQDWIIEGTDEWSSFQSFVFTETELEIYFSSYQVASYADGTPHVSIPYPLIAKLVREEYVTALNIKRYTYD